MEHRRRYDFDQDAKLRNKEMEGNIKIVARPDLVTSKEQILRMPTSNLAESK